MIDWSKPVIARNVDRDGKVLAGTKHFQVHIVAQEYCDVDSKESCVAARVNSGGWTDIIKFNPHTGKAIGHHGSSYRLMNAPEKKEVFVRVNAWGETSIHNYIPGGTAVAVVKLNVEDGIIIDASLVQKNVEELCPTFTERMKG